MDIEIKNKILHYSISIIVLCIGLSAYFRNKNIAWFFVVMFCALITSIIFFLVLRSKTNETVKQLTLEKSSEGLQHQAQIDYSYRITRKEVYSSLLVSLVILFIIFGYYLFFNEFDKGFEIGPFIAMILFSTLAAFGLSLVLFSLTKINIGGKGAFFAVSALFSMIICFISKEFFSLNKEDFIAEFIVLLLFTSGISSLLKKFKNREKKD